MHDNDGNPVEIPYYRWVTSTPEEEQQLMQLRSMQLEKRTSDVSDVLDVMEKLDSAPEDVQNCLPNQHFDFSSLKVIWFYLISKCD